MNHGRNARSRAARAIALACAGGAFFGAAPAASAQAPVFDFTAPAVSTLIPTTAPTTLSVAGPANIARVTFSAGGRELCVVGPGPFDCAYTPIPRDVGLTTFIARAFDGAGRLVGVAVRDQNVDTFKPVSISTSIRPRRDRRAPYRFRIRGAIALPAGVTAADVCFGGSVLITARHRGGTDNELAAVGRDCTYSVSILTARGSIRLAAAFRGNQYLSGVTSRSRRVRAG
jgi:hypothetical protein